MSRSFIIDTDTASDDAVALIMALRAPDVDVKAITVVSGNVPLEQGVRNALYTVELCGADVPVYAGAARPLVREPSHADWYHGRDGLGDRGYPAPQRQPAAGHAVDALLETITANPGIVLVTLGPLTNVALAVSRAPEIVRNVSRCIVMGGAACTVGNVTPAAEYNIWCDPEAARIVFHSGLPVEMIGWELCRFDANLNEADMAYVRGLNTPLAHFTLDCNETAMQANFIQTGAVGISLPDPVAMAVALDPTICTRSSKHRVEIETQSELTRGMTVVDQLGVANDERNRDVWRPLLANPSNVTVCWEIDALRWKQMLYQALV
ncbi:MAG: nucleoside hydrolase [Chloroflexi bacterium]|nr:nucleoside hydrolase [Chloroflexota bacterium]